MALSEQAKMALIGIASTAVALGVFGAFRAPEGAGDPREAVPKESFLVASIDLADLRKSPLAELLLGKTTHRALGLPDISEACGFDPIARVDRLAVAVPEEGARGELGVAARIDVTRSELEACAKAVRGGETKTEQRGSFVVATSQGEKGSALAYGKGGLLVVGRGTWFDAMLDAADHRHANVKASPEHAALEAVLTRDPTWRHPTILVTAILPESVRAKIRREMDDEARAVDGAGLAVPSDAPGQAGGGPRPAAGARNTLMAGVLDVSSIGLALRAGVPGGEVEARAELVCDNAPACAEVEKLILRKRLEWSKDLAIRMVGFGPVIDALDVNSEGTRLHVSVHANADTLRATFDRVLHLAGGGRGRADRGDRDRPDGGDGRAPSVLVPAPRGAGFHD